VQSRSRRYLAGLLPSSWPQPRPSHWIVSDPHLGLRTPRARRRGGFIELIPVNRAAMALVLIDLAAIEQASLAEMAALFGSHRPPDRDHELLGPIVLGRDGAASPVAIIVAFRRRRHPVRHGRIAAGVRRGRAARSIAACSPKSGDTAGRRSDAGAPFGRRPGARDHPAAPGMPTIEGRQDAAAKRARS